MLIILVLGLWLNPYVCLGCVGFDSGRDTTTMIESFIIYGFNCYPLTLKSPIFSLQMFTAEVHLVAIVSFFWPFSC